MDLTLSEEQQSFRDLARDFLDKEAVPHRIQWDRDESVDLAIIPKMAEIGFFGLTIPEEYGGLGGDYVTYAIAMEELGRADSALRGIVSVSQRAGRQVDPGLRHRGAEAGVAAAAGRRRPALGCFGLTEPDTGSDAGNLTSRADQGRRRLRPQRPEALHHQRHLGRRRAGLRPHQRRRARAGVTAFLVPTDTPGFEAREIKGKLGLRGQATAELFLSDVRVPASARARRGGPGLQDRDEHPRQGPRLGRRRLRRASCRAASRPASTYAKSRTQFGRPIAGFQLVQDMIADISLDADAARLLVWRCADLIDRGEPFGTAASKAKLFASEAAVRAANNCIQVYGGSGYVDEYPGAKYLRDARVMTLYEGTSQIQKLLIGRAETGISAFV